MPPRVNPNEYLPLEELAKLLPGNPDRSTLWRRINRGVKAGDGVICFLKAARDGKKLYSSVAWWYEHVREVGLHDQLQRNRDAGNDTRRRRPPGKHLSDANTADTAEAANLAAAEAGW